MLFLVLIFLIFLSAFFSASETGMMAINRYRLRHLARKSDTHAMRVLKLLERPDRLLSIILFGNTVTNVAASAVATFLAVQYYGDLGVALVTIALTFVLLILAETAPKTYAALYPQRVAFLAASPLLILLKILNPIVWAINNIANGLLLIFGVRVKRKMPEPLSIEELRSVVHESIDHSTLSYQHLLLRVLDLQKVTVAEAMIPKNEIYGIDLELEWSIIVERLVNSPHDYLPVYRDNIDHAKGILMLRRVLAQLRNPQFTKIDLIREASEIYYIPESALLHQQLLNFQREQKTIGLVVNEYGDIQGILTLQDVLEEIVGEFAMSATEIAKWISPQKDGSALVNASITVRDLNRLAHWHLPDDGPRTLSGLIVEHLEMIPKVGVSINIGGYAIDVLSVSHNKIFQVRVFPA